MIPAFFVQMGELPLLASGKVDRRALPAPAVEEGAPRRERVEARNNIERGLSLIWREVLATTEFGATDDFFILAEDSVARDASASSSSKGIPGGGFNPYLI